MAAVGVSDGTLIDRVDVLGVGISAIGPDAAVAEITRWITDGVRHYVCVTGVHGVMEAWRHPELIHIHNRSGLTTPDGMPMVWAARLAGAKHVQRVYGPDLMLALCERAAERGWRCYMYGGTEQVVNQLHDRLTARFPGLRIVGAYSPPFRELTIDEDESAIRAINAAKPDILWVGLGTPKQERWMAVHRGRLEVPVIIGVGAAFNIHAGTLRQAPRWMQKSGLEWLFRLAVEPRRLWRRYLRNIPGFLLAISRRRPHMMCASPKPEDP
jgi:N-acetylglucosaminyldiphosphoundecaprenol N-acetyl-beta-D-mannosaminyltransferase